MEKGEEAEEKETFPLVDVVCLNENWGYMETEIHKYRTVGISTVDLDQG